MTIEAKIIADSISESGKRITTMQVKFHRFILPEFNTHRVFSRNFSSSRAIPTKKLLEQVRNDPALPVHWGKNQPGMQAKEELDGDEVFRAKARWRLAAYIAADQAEILSEIGVHKQIVNRVIEPYIWAHGVVTSTEFDNWDQLRAHEDAQPEIHALALAMLEARNASTPRLLKRNEWHLPYVSDAEISNIKTSFDLEQLKKISAARCCRVSYLKHDGSSPNQAEDLALFDRLAGSVPLHASPLEHQATPDLISTDGVCSNPELHGNFKGWIQYRKQWEIEIYKTTV